MFTRALDRITRVQYALITRVQALAAGLTDAEISARLRNGTWIEIRPSVYVIAGAPQSWHQVVLASLLAFGCDTWASHATAAHLWALKGFDQPEQLELVSTLKSRTRLSGVRGRQSGALFESDLTRRHRIPTVTAERALIDVSSRLTTDRLGRVLDDAIRRKLIDLEEFRRCAQRVLPAPGRSISKVHAVLAARIPGYDPGDSDLETRALRALTAAGLPPPKQQHRMVLRGKKVRIDLAYPELKIAIELDSWKYHGGENYTAFTDDRARKNDLIALGWAAPSFTESMADEYFVSVIRELHRAAIERQSVA
jgi:hypothetical protein